MLEAEKFQSLEQSLGLRGWEVVVHVAIVFYGFSPNNIFTSLSGTKEEHTLYFQRPRG